MLPGDEWQPYWRYSDEQNGWNRHRTWSYQNEWVVIFVLCMNVWIMVTYTRKNRHFLGAKVNVSSRHRSQRSSVATSVHSTSAEGCEWWTAGLCYRMHAAMTYLRALCGLQWPLSLNDLAGEQFVSPGGIFRTTCLNHYRRPMNIAAQHNRCLSKRCVLCWNLNCQRSLIEKWRSGTF